MPGSVRGPWTYDTAAHALAWTGALTPSIPITLGVDLQVAAGIATGTILPLTARLDAGDGLILPAEAPVQVDVPWLTLALAAPGWEVQTGDVLDFELTAANGGVIGTTARLTETLPSGLTLVAGSAKASSGEITSAAGRLTWTGVLAPGDLATIRFKTAVTLPQPGARLVTRADLTDEPAG